MHKPIYYEGDLKKLDTALNLTRTAQNSKKRLLHFKLVSKPIAMRCYSLTEESERLNLKDFFVRHSRYAKHPVDNCSMIHNCWETEFHLSYYQLLRGPPDPQCGIAASDTSSMPFPGDREMQVVRASASFRFNGDFFDRHWTCYMLDSTHKNPISDPDLLAQRTYCQRKVLEQRYFADILTSLNGSVKEILHEVKKCLGVKSGSFSISLHTINAYLSWSARWQEFEPLVQMLDNDLASTQTTVNQWETRETERGKEKPRWTPNDERKYRASIMTIRREIKHQVNQLQRLRERTKAVHYLCSNRLDKAREDLRFRSEQNIAMFTYVTVVFLPLGFTASIFSMNGIPERSIAINMVIAATAALIVTIMALWNAKGLISIAEIVSKKFKDLTAAKKQSSLIMRGRNKLENKDKTSNAGYLSADPAGTSSTTFGSDLIFWIGYIYIEAPARAIVTACRALGWSRFYQKDRTSAEDINDPKAVSGVVQESLDGASVCNPSDSKSSFHLPQISTRRRGSEPICDGASPNPPEEAHRGGHGYVGKISRVIVGLSLVPWFLAIWSFRIICFNIWDALALLRGKPV